MRRRFRALAERLPPLLAVPVHAVRNYIAHQSANQAGSVAFSSLLSLFPLLLFVAAAAAFAGQPGSAAGLMQRVLEYAPPLVTEVLRPVVDGLLAQPSRTLLTVGVIFTLWTASSGVQSVRTALNRAYGVDRGLSFWRARIKVTLFTLLGTVLIVLVFGSIVVLPYVWQLVRHSGASDAQMSWLLDAARYALAYLTLVALYASMYGYLPDMRQRLRSVLPGALVGALLWLLAAAFLSYSLRSAGKLALVYGGFTGLVATLVFLYVSAVTLIFGAELNAVLRERAPSSTAFAVPGLTCRSMPTMDSNPDFDRPACAAPQRDRLAPSRTAVQGAADAVPPAAQGAHASLDRLPHGAQQDIDQARASADACAGNTRRVVRDHPLASICGAFALGALFARRVR
jgi:membrane protein